MKSLFFFKKTKLLVLFLSMGFTLSSCISVPGMPDFNSRLTPKSERSVPNRDFKLIKISYNNITHLSRHRTKSKLKMRPKQKHFYVRGHARGIGGYTYTIGAQDILSITVWGQPELTIPAGEFRSPTAAGHKVDRDGYFFFPYAGKIKAAERTTEQVRLELTKKLAKYITDPQVGVSIAAYRSQRAYISGQVMQPGVFEINDTPLTVRDAIAKAGGLKQLIVKKNGVDRNKSKSYGSDNYKITYGSSGSNGMEITELPKRALLTTANKNKIQISLEALFERGDKSQNYVLQGGDALHVFLPKQQQQMDKQDDPERLKKIFVLGEVKQPGTILLDEYGATLAEALSDRGGINEDTANAKGIFVVRSNPRSSNAIPIVYQLELKSIHSMILAEKFALKERDIVYVTAAPISRWNRVISQILPSLDSATSIDNLAK